MKTILYTTITTLFIISAACKSVDKLVDQGRYDEAIVLATKKLAGKKNKKTKHIKALEKAFAKVNERDLQHINFLKAEDRGDSWGEVFDYALRINARQDKVFPFLPLVSKENYVGSFELINTSIILEEARSKAAAYAYDQGIQLLERAKSLNDKILAQDAHYAFSSIGKYFDHYKNSTELIYESIALGTFHILLKWNLPLGIEPRGELLSRRYANELDQRWIKYHTEFDEGISFDAISTFHIEDIDISREREVINHFAESKDLEKWVEKLDKDGNVMKDSIGNAITYLLVERVNANISEYLRSKNALFTGSVETINFSNGSLISQERFNHEISFESDACTIVGDRRALPDGIRKRIDNTLLPFPTDYDMIDDGLGKMNNDFMYHLKRLDIADLYSDNIASR